MTGSIAAMLILLIVAAVLLVAGGVYQIATGRNRSKGVLMLIAAAVLAGNVAVWTL